MSKFDRYAKLLFS
jgi:hypothetical protein